MANFKTFTIRDNTHVVSGSNVYFDFARKNMISTVWSLRDDNETFTASGWYGDGCIAEDSIKIHDDLILSVGWNDGFAVRRMEDAGTFENIYYDNTPVGSVINMTSITLDKTNYKAYVSTFQVDSGVARYDYSDCFGGGGDVVTKDGVLTEASNDLPTDRVGYNYSNGLKVVGDYLYMVDYASVSNLERWKISTEEKDILTVNGYRNAGYRGKVIYDEEHNRIFICWLENGEIWMVINPENASDDPIAPAKCYNLRINSVSFNVDCRTYYVSVDRYNANHLYFASYYGQFGKIDITNIVEEIDPNPTLLWVNLYKWTTNNSGPPWWFANRMSIKTNPVIPNKLPIISSYGDFYAEWGWLDIENFIPVGTPMIWNPGFYDDSTTSAKVWSDVDLLRFSYGPTPVLVESSGGNKYWVHAGYSWDGYKFRSWDFDTFPNGLCLESKGEIIFGTYSLDSNESVGEVILTDIADQVYIPSGGCKLICLVSNNNGTTWEKYGWREEESHNFKSTGYQIKVKFIFYGNIYNASHINSSHFINVTLIERNDISQKSRIYRHGGLMGR